jgi:F-type H+-transporting ATPase subunit epsilon
MKLELVTLDGIKFQKDVYEVLLPTENGQIGVLPGHMPLISVATRGVISIRRKADDSDDELEHYATNGGVIEIQGNLVRVLVDEADHEQEINFQETEEAIKRAQELMSSAKIKLR